MHRLQQDRRSGDARGVSDEGGIAVVRFEHEFSVDAPAERAWAFLMNVPEMAGCIPGTSEIKQIDNDNFDATVSTKIGPITAKFGCRITILERDADGRTAAVEMSGKDNRLGGGVKGKMAMSLSDAGEGSTLVRIVSDVDILGKIGQYGHGMLAKRAEAMLTDFAACARAQLA
jgi:uncharacterized protein